MTLNIVVLPAPFGPMSPVILPRSAWRSTPSRATRPPKRTTMPEATRPFMVLLPSEAKGGQCGVDDRAGLETVEPVQIPERPRLPVGIDAERNSGDTDGGAEPGHRVAGGVVDRDHRRP